MYDIVADEFGEVTITVAPGTPTSAFGLIGALIIQGYTPSNSSIPTPPARQLIVEKPVNQVNVAQEKAIIKAYPNPFDQYFTLEVSTQQADKLNVLVYDVNGRLIYQRSYGNLNSGSNTIRVQPDKVLSPGVYFVKAIVGDGSDSGLIKIVKK